MGAQAALAFAVLWAATAQEPHQAPQASPPGKKDAPQGAPPLQPIAGLNGFESVSTLVYVLAPDRPHRLEATYVFPERVRWRLSAGVEEKAERHIHYRFGAQVYLVPAGTAGSRELVDEERLDVLRQTELRRAVMLWPDGFQWKGEGAERTADLGPLGSLRARFVATADPRPAEIIDLDASGKSIDAFRAVTWKETDRRFWPAAMELWHEGSLVWKETVDSIQTTKRFIDSYFVPGDRREAVPRGPQTGQVRELDLPESCALRVQLADGTSWAEAQAELVRLRGVWSERLKAQGQELDRAATFEVSKELSPTACLLRLAKVPEKPPEGFATVHARKGVTVAVAGLTEATSARLDGLRSALPKGTLAQTPYLRFDPQDGGRGHVLLVLPFSTADRARQGDDLSPR